MKKAWLGVAAVALLGACGGDYRNGFVGNWGGTDTVTVTGTQSGSLPTDFPVTVSIGETGRDGLQVSGFECPFTATANNSNDFTIDPGYTCTVQSPPDAAGVTCAYTLQYTGGGGTRSGRTIAYAAQGTAAWVCSDNTRDSGTFTEQATIGY